MNVSKRRGRQGRPRPRPTSDPAIGRDHDVEIATLGRNGDGMADLDGQPIFVPQALPGDLLRVRLIAKRSQGYTAKIIEQQRLAERIDPPCPHFGSCGGCQLQHMPADRYHHWKTEQLRTALSNRGLDGIEIRPMIKGHTSARRRVRLAFPAGGRGRNLGRKSSGGMDKTTFRHVELGFRAYQSREIVPIDVCPIATPSITAILAPLKRLLGGLGLAAGGGELHLAATDTGLDLLLETQHPPDLADLESLSSFADTHDLARLAWRQDAKASPEPIAARRPALVTMGQLQVALPTGAFLQATEQAESDLRKAVMEAIGESQTVADLFSGCGTFGLPLAAEGRRVIAFERAPSMVLAMQNAAKAAGIAQRLTIEPRDLERQPLDRSDLLAVDAAIVDPPRAGARTQVNALAVSAIKKIAMVSCNPTTFARDAKTLIDGGYRLLWVQPIDVFLWSAEIELVAAFERSVSS